MFVVFSYRVVYVEKFYYKSTIPVLKLISEILGKLRNSSLHTLRKIPKVII